ncbi:MAG: dtd [Bacillales bacterium]|jgi:D-tyrosyl-tRNA(Tyr) deacylase|nr:dtd [Bacillales bacterium]
MKVVIQRVSAAEVSVDSEIVGKINNGLLLLVGITHSDDEVVLKTIAEKIVNLRIFEDDAEKMNLSLLDVKGEILSVSQFTLYADCKKGRRPAFTDAARPEYATELYNKFNNILKSYDIKVGTGMFGAMMDVKLTNKGPVTIILDSNQLIK